DIGETETAIQKAEMARIFAPGDVVPFEQLKDIYISRKDAKRAQSVLSRLIQMKKDYAPYYTQLAALNIHEGDRAAALNNLTRAVQLDPQDVLHHGAYLRLAQL